MESVVPGRRDSGQPTRKLIPNIEDTLGMRMREAGGGRGKGDWQTVESSLGRS